MTLATLPRNGPEEQVFEMSFVAQKPAIDLTVALVNCPFGVA